MDGNVPVMGDWPTADLLGDDFSSRAFPDENGGVGALLEEEKAKAVEDFGGKDAVPGMGISYDPFAEPSPPSTVPKPGGRGGLAEDVCEGRLQCPEAQHGPHQIGEHGVVVVGD